MRAMLAANEHHAETGRTSNRREFRLAVLALRRVRRDRGATVWTIECLRLHCSGAERLRAFRGHRVRERRGELSRPLPRALPCSSLLSLAFRLVSLPR